MLFVLTTLATYWAWWVPAKSALLKRLREAFYNRYPPDPVRRKMVGVWSRDLGDVVMRERVTKDRTVRVSQFSKMLDCPWCAGFWLAGLVTLGLDLHGSVPLPALWWPATSIAVAAVDRVLR